MFTADSFQKKAGNFFFHSFHDFPRLLIVIVDVVVESLLATEQREVQPDIP